MFHQLSAGLLSRFLPFTHTHTHTPSVHPSLYILPRIQIAVGRPSGLGSSITSCLPPPIPPISPSFDLTLPPPSPLRPSLCHGRERHKSTRISVTAGPARSPIPSYSLQYASEPLLDPNMSADTVDSTYSHSHICISRAGRRSVRALHVIIVRTTRP